VRGTKELLIQGLKPGPKRIKISSCYCIWVLTSLPTLTEKEFILSKQRFWQQELKEFFHRNS
jgi:hypothetical protein